MKPEGSCSFQQSYGEGSSYSGFLVRDLVHFGEGYHPDLDAFNFTFGCATTETHLFYLQEADGILGMTKGNMAAPQMRPIFEVMKERKIIDNSMFSLCLGKNGGYF
jgi:Eukaryotic aspartyl protease